MFFKKGEYILLFNYFHVIFFIICTVVLTGAEQNISLEHIKQQCIEKCPVQVCPIFFYFHNKICFQQQLKLIKPNIQTIRKVFFFLFAL